MMTSFAPLVGFGSDNMIQQIIEEASNEGALRGRRFYLGRILEGIFQDTLSSLDKSKIPSDFSYALTRVKELREEFGEEETENPLQRIGATLSLKTLRASSPYLAALRNYVSKAVKSPAVSFLTPLPTRKAWSPLVDRVQQIAEEFYEDPTCSEYAIQVVASRMLSMQARLNVYDEEEIGTFFAGNLRDFRLINNQQEIDAQMKKARDRAQAGIDRPGKYVAFLPRFLLKRKEKEAPFEIESGWELGVGIAHAKGDRPTMEDTHLIGMLRPAGCLKGDGNVYAIFDGHHGKEVALFARENLIRYIQHHLVQQDHPHLSMEGNMFNALKLALVDLSEGCKQLVGGTTAAIAIRVGQKLLVVNVGDSRVLINSSKLGFIQATEDAEPGEEYFKKSLEKRGGRLEKGYGEWRVVSADGFETLSMARALGDEPIPGVTARPKITCFDLEELGEGSQLIICCDGIFEGFSSLDVLTLVKRLKEQGKNSKEIAEWLDQEAHRIGSGDNLSAMVVDL